MSLRIENLTLAHRGTVVVENFTLGCRDGEVVALVGPNGAGKSTLLRAIFGSHQALSGAVSFRDRRAAQTKRRLWQSGIGYMPQDNAANGSLTALEAVLLGAIEELSFRIAEPVLRRAAAALQRFGMLQFSHRRLETLSGGQRQIVYFAQALMREPGLLLLDEPASALDLRHQMLLMSHVREETLANGLVTIVVLHDLTLAASFADRIVVLQDGRTAASGSPADVLTSELLRTVYGVEAVVQRDDDNRLWVRVDRALV